MDLHIIIEPPWNLPNLEKWQKDLEKQIPSPHSKVYLPSGYGQITQARIL